MARSKKSVTLSVHRAVIDETLGWNIAELLSMIREGLKPGDYTIDRGFWGRIAVKFPSFPRTNEAVAAQFGLYEEGAKKSTIKDTSSSEAYSTKPVSAPEDSDFLDHQVALLAEGNYLIACGLGKRQATLIDTISRFAEKCGVKVPPGTIAFVETPNSLTIEEIRQRGVKSIQFDAGNLLGSLETKTDSLLGHIFGRNAQVSDFEREDMVAQLSIHPRKARKTTIGYDIQHKNQWLSTSAEKTLEDEQVDSYTIVLDDDTVWPEGKLKLTKSIDVLKDGGSSYQVEDALAQMLEYFDHLKRNGHLQ